MPTPSIAAVLLGATILVWGILFRLAIKRGATAKIVLNAQAISVVLLVSAGLELAGKSNIFGTLLVLCVLALSTARELKSYFSKRGSE